MKSTTKLAVVTAQTKREMQIGNKAHGEMTRTGRRSYFFKEDEVVETTGNTTKKNAKNRAYPELQWKNIDHRRHASLDANVYGVKLHAYIRYDECTCGQQMSGKLLNEITELCEMLSLLDINALAQRCAEQTEG